MLKGILSKNIFIYALCMVSGILYMYGLCIESTVLQNAFTVIFIIFLIFLFCINIIRNSESGKFPIEIIFQLILLNFSIALSAFFLKTPQSNFLVQDSLYTHLPEAIKYVPFFKGYAIFSTIESFASGRSTHIITGMFISIFGDNVFSTIIAQLFFKIIAVTSIYYIAKNLWNDKIASISVLIYGLCPTIFFYNLVLYKESAVQALFAISLLSIIKIFIKKKYQYFAPLTFSFYLLLNERFYIAYLLLPMIYLLMSNLIYSKNKKAFTIFIGLTSLLFISSLLYFWHHVTSAITYIQQQRQFHSSFTDTINQFNYQIPYPLAFVKIMFSPYFSLNKFAIFTGLSSMLTWGSFLNQFIILCSILGLLKSVKLRFFHIFLWSSFILFLLIAAYVSPWSGRLRDSFYPLIACYCAYFISNLSSFNKYFFSSDSND